MKTWFVLPLLLSLVVASVGDYLPEFQDCLEKCNDVQCVSHTQFGPHHLNPIAKTVFLWDCSLDCNYKCQQLITQERKQAGMSMVQFYGKWPFRRIFGVTEFLSSLFSMANLYVNHVNFKKVTRYYGTTIRNNSETSGPRATMLWQYVILLGVSILGWFCSTLFHIRDFPLTETMDYLGAGGIMVANFNSIVVRHFRLFDKEKTTLRYAFQTFVCLVLLYHYSKLMHHWDYDYNMRFNLVFGLLSLTLWILHSYSVHEVYSSNTHFYNNSMQLLPFETKILAKLNYVGLSRSKYIPLIPVALNVFLILSVSLEILDFPPWFQLIDSHSLWHVCTIFPPIVWYDWNIWDLEMDSLTVKHI